VRADGSVPPGSIVTADGSPEAGVVTSAATAPGGDGSVAIVRVRWASADAPLRTVEGLDLLTVGSLD